MSDTPRPPIGTPTSSRGVRVTVYLDDEHARLLLHLAERLRTDDGFALPLSGVVRRALVLLARKEGVKR